MTEDSLPTRGSLSRALEICEYVDRTGKTREEIINKRDDSSETVKRDIRTGLRLGLLDESDSGVRATNPGLNAAQAPEGSDRRKDAVQQLIVGHPIYPLIFERVVSSSEDDQILAVDVDRIVRDRGNELGKESRGAASTAFLKTLEMAGIGEYKKSWGDYPERLEINDEERLTELRSQIQDKHFNPTDTGADAARAAGSEEPAADDTSPETPTDGSESVPAAGAGSPTPPTPSPLTRGATPPAHSKETNFDIKLSLDGTEDPQRIERLVAAVQRGLTAPPEGVTNEPEPPAPTDEPVAAETTEPPSPSENTTPQSDAGPAKESVEVEPGTATADSETGHPTDEDATATSQSIDGPPEEPTSTDTAETQTDDDSDNDPEPKGLNRFG